MAKKPTDKKVLKRTVNDIVHDVQAEYKKIDEPFDKAHVKPKIVNQLTEAFEKSDDKVDPKLVAAITKRVATYGTKKDLGFAKKAVKKVLKKKAPNKKK